MDFGMVLVGMVAGLGWFPLELPLPEEAPAPPDVVPPPVPPFPLLLMPAPVATHAPSRHTCEVHMHSESSKHFTG
jgi:hypothetical protein